MWMECLLVPEEKGKEKSRLYSKGWDKQQENGWCFFTHMYIWAASRQNQHSAFATSMDQDQPAHPRSLIRIHTVRYQFLYLL
jgi:hypothetical protein